MEIEHKSKQELLDEINQLRKKLGDLERKLAPADLDKNFALDSLNQDIDIVIFFDENGKFHYVNSLWKDKLNYKDEYIPYIRLRDTMHPKEWNRIQETINHLKETNEKVKIDTIFNAKNGESIYVSGSLKLEIYGNQPYYVGIFHDVTERVRANRAERLYYSIANLTLQTASLSKLFNAIHHELQNVIDTRNFYIAIADKRKNKIVFPFIKDENTGPDSFSKDRIWSNGITEYVIGENKAMILTQDKILDLFLRQKLVLYGPLPKVFMAVPFQTESDNLGLIAMQNYEDENAYTEKDLELLNFISGQIALAIVRKQNEEKISSQAARLQAIFDSSSHVIWSIGKDYRITSYNSNFITEIVKIYGDTIPKEHQENIREVLKYIPEPTIMLWKEKYDQVFSGQHLQFELELKNNKGKSTWKQIFLNPIYLNSKKIEAVSCIVHDITEKKRSQIGLEESEVKFRSIFESFQDVYFRCDLKGNILMLSPSVEELTGFKPDKIISNDITNYYLYNSRTKDLLRQLIKKKSVRNFEATIIRKNGELLQCICNVRLVNDKTSKVVAIEGVARDITKLKRANEELMEAKILAENSLKVKEMFLANMSHEIRTPMNGIIGMVDLLAQTETNDEKKGYIDTIKKSSETLLHILNDILDLSKIEAGKMKLRNQVMDVDGVISKVFTLFNQQAKSRRINFNYEISKDIPPYLKIDETRLIQILANLTSNALKFTHEYGNVLIKLEKATAVDKRDVKNLYRIEVIDDGIGISIEDQQKLFKTFTQADTSTTKNFSGTGLGLAISRQLARLMKGDIGVKSNTDKGSTFWFTFMAEQASKKEIDDYHLQTKESLSEIKHFNKLYFSPKILLVDDNQINRQVAGTILSKIGCNISVAVSGEEAISMVAENDYDLIFMDIQMPKMDGIEATNKIKMLDKKLPPIIAMTAYSMKDDKKKFISQGLDDYLAKPINAKSIAQKVHDYLGERLQLSEENKRQTDTKNGSSPTTLINQETLLQLKKYADTDTILQIYSDFESESLDIIHTCLEAEKSADEKIILSKLHTLKGNSGTLGIENIAALSKKIESDLKESNKSYLQTDLQDLEKLINIFKDNYKKYI